MDKKFTKKVLVVDDEDDVRDMIRRILRFSSYEVVEARDGAEAMDKAVVEKPDLITLDIMMPGKDGIRLCEELKQKPETRHIPIMILTVAGSRRRVLAAGADMYMNKLFSIDEFVSAVDLLVNRAPAAP
jgi:two-component system response regulator ResD